MKKTLNPIAQMESVQAKFNRSSGKYGIKNALPAFRPAECANYFKAAGCRAT